MPNPIHLIASPARAGALAATVGATHLRYTRQINRGGPCGAGGGLVLVERWGAYRGAV